MAEPSHCFGGPAALDRALVAGIQAGPQSVCKITYDRPTRLVPLRAMIVPEFKPGRGHCPRHRGAT